MNKIDINQLKQNHQMIHFFGLGFVQLKIDNNLRMHFYHPDLTAIIQDEEVHNHRYDFISTILAGEFTNLVFGYHNNPEGMYFIEKESCNLNNKLEIKENDIISVDLFKINETTYTKGQSYTCLSNQFHTVKTEFAITRLYRGQITSDFATIIRKKELEKVCPFSKQLSASECWNIVEDSLIKGNIIF